MGPLYIAGHSLGAAMAVLMAVMLVTDPAYAGIVEKLRAVYAFGQPNDRQPRARPRVRRRPGTPTEFGDNVLAD
jgi:hypothetical protein